MMILWIYQWDDKHGSQCRPSLKVAFLGHGGWNLDYLGVVVKKKSIIFHLAGQGGRPVLSGGGIPLSQDLASLALEEMSFVHEWAA